MAQSLGAANPQLKRRHRENGREEFGGISWHNDNVRIRYAAFSLVVFAIVPVKRLKWLKHINRLQKLVLRIPQRQIF